MSDDDRNGAGSSWLRWLRYAFSTVLLLLFVAYPVMLSMEIKAVRALCDSITVGEPLIDAQARASARELSGRSVQGRDGADDAVIYVSGMTLGDVGCVVSHNAGRVTAVSPNHDG
jgi:hypothetical protein